MVKFLFLVLAWLPIFVYGQGKLMLVGGGSEKSQSWGWSNAPYRWAVENAPNRRVAIISYSESNDPSWLPDYFISLGAEEAENFVIEDQEEANNNQLFDELKTYDLIFFKGGDQSVYYSEYKDTELSKAVEAVYADGGVIAGTSAGMAILSGIIYSAEKNTLYPDQALGGQAPDFTTLRDDMFPFLDGYLGDTHFAERGRLPRLVTFLGEAESTHENQITGIGVDDQTAFCIDENGIGIVYGTGAVTIVELSNYSIVSGGIPQANAQLTSVLHGYSYDLEEHKLLENYSQDISAESPQISLPGELYLTGSDPYVHNEDLLKGILEENDRPWIIFGPAGAQVEHYIAGLENLGAEVSHVQPDIEEDPCQTVVIRNTLREGAILVFVGNDPSGLFDYFDSHPTGKVIIEAFQNALLSTIMIGNDAMLAGAIRVTNNKDDEMNAYYGDLAFSEGIGLLPSSIVLTEVYDPSSTDFYENNTQSGIFALIDGQLGNALYLNERSWIHISPVESLTQIRSGGDYAAMRLKNSGRLGAIANQPVDASGNSRNVVGYDQIELTFIGPDPLSVGEVISPEILISDPELVGPEILIATLEEESIRLEWDYTDAQEGQWRLEKAVIGEDFTQLVILPGDSRVFIDDDVQQGVEYTYRIRRETDQMSSCYAVATGIMLITSVGNAEQDLKVYPNPAEGRLFIENVKGRGYYQLIDLGNREWHNGSFNVSVEIPLKFIPAGLYILRVQTGEIVQYRKIAVKSGRNTLTQN